MGSLCGLLLGLGGVLMWRSGPRRPARRTPSRPRWHVRLDEALAQAGVEAVTPAHLLAISAVLAAIVFLLTTGVSRSPAIGLAFGSFSAAGPVTLVRWRARQRASELRDLWPEVADNLASAVRAGLALPEAVSQLAVRGPAPLRRPFALFAEDYRATGRFAECLDRLKGRLADPVGDRIVESLRLAREVGGTDLGRLLRSLSAFLREDARTRAELETRQSWTVNAARMAVAAPWLVLGLLSLHPESVRAYNSPAGVVVLLIGVAASVVGYRVMKRIGRLPTEGRVLR